MRWQQTDNPDAPALRRCKLTAHRESGASTAPSGQTAAQIGATAPEGKNGETLSPDALHKLALASLEDDQAGDIVSIDLRGKSALADHMVVASGRSTRHVAAIVEKLVERLKHDGHVVPRLEGAEQGDWALIDAGDIIVHVFRPEVREFYNLERMWLPEGEAPKTAPLSS